MNLMRRDDPKFSEFKCAAITKGGWGCHRTVGPNGWRAQTRPFIARLCAQHRFIWMEEKANDILNHP